MRGEKMEHNDEVFPPSSSKVKLGDKLKSLKKKKGGGSKTFNLRWVEKSLLSLVKSESSTLQISLSVCVQHSASIALSPLQIARQLWAHFSCVQRRCKREKGVKVSLKDKATVCDKTDFAYPEGETAPIVKTRISSNEDYPVISKPFSLGSPSLQYR